ncbi:DUF3558 domain-containing protein [Amycolatopsis sp. NPDC000673]
MTTIAVVGATFVAGCSGSPTPAPDLGATRPSPPATGKPLPYAGAPKVGHPLPESVLSAHPCDSALTAEQVSGILAQTPQGEHDDIDALGAQCHWTNIDAGAIVTVLYGTKTSDGLSAVYANTKPRSTMWQPLPPVHGLPAVAHSTYSAEGSKSFCQVSVGVTDRRTVDVSITLGQAKVGRTAPCAVDAQITGMVVANLKQKAGA